MAHSGNCVLGWYPDDSVKGDTNLKPVVCSTVISSLSTIIAKMSLGEILMPEEHDIVNALCATHLVHEDDFGPVLRLVKEGV